MTHRLLPLRHWNTNEPSKNALKHKSCGTSSIFSKLRSDPHSCDKNRNVNELCTGHHTVRAQMPSVNAGLKKKRSCDMNCIASAPACESARAPVRCSAPPRLFRSLPRLAERARGLYPRQGVPVNNAMTLALCSITATCLLAHLTGHSVLAVRCCAIYATLERSRENHTTRSPCIARRRKSWTWPFHTLKRRSWEVCSSYQRG